MKNEILKNNTDLVIEQIIEIFILIKFSKNSRKMCVDFFYNVFSPTIELTVVFLTILCKILRIFNSRITVKKFE